MSLTSIQYNTHTAEFYMKALQQYTVLPYKGTVDYCSLALAPDGTVP
jgi:hypothetical protein